MRAQSPICDVGSSVVELLYFQSTGANAKIDRAVLGSSIVFLKECPSSVIPAFEKLAAYDSALHGVWIDAVRSTAQDVSDSSTRLLLAAAKPGIAEVHDPALDAFLDGIFQSGASIQVETHSLALAFERQALATLKQSASCDGAACFNASDNVLFLLGIQPIAVLKAMHADSVDGRKWLRTVADRSFAGDKERSASREAARRAILASLQQTSAPELEPEQSVVENVLRTIRYRPVE
ncbi:MAG TPA: hypothetical protein VMH88_08450 [Gemmatimonadales bacterium]|nr:hypothetical protein [Gemmatimonadales bacterium]